MKIVDAEKTELKVGYCIPDWLREEQMKASIARFTERIKPYQGTRTEPVAIVCFGPSLNQTWEKIKDFKYIISCSGAHKYLRDRGLTPTWHVDVDPRAHKAELIGDDISSDTEFLMASCCHPKVFDHLEKHNAKITLWHTYSGESTAMMPLIYPRGEWVSTGGANVGLRAFMIARLLGFKELHIFGMDGSFPQDDKVKHAAPHPNSGKGYIVAQYEGKDYCTTTAFLECARGTFHELRMLPDTNVIFYGDGLIQDMAKKKIPEIKYKDKADIAFYLAPTISADYIAQNVTLHQNPEYGVTVFRHIETIKKIYEKTESRSLLDYGCGKGLLAKSLDFPIWEYDPAVAGKNNPPRPADLVVCVDVLEHIEPDYLDATLIDLSRCIKKVGYFIIAAVPSTKNLPDGRNSHLIIQGLDWWKEKLKEYFLIPDNGAFSTKIGEIHFIVSPLHDSKYYRQRFTLFSREEENEHCVAA